MKILLKLSLIFILAFGVTINFSNADDPTGATGPDDARNQQNSAGANTPAATATEGGKTIKITVTEKIPGVDCGIKGVSGPDAARDQINSGVTRYECFVPIGWTAFLAVLGRMIRFMTGAAILCAVLFLVFNGIRLSMSGVDGEAKGKVKSNIMMTLGGIILLLLSGPILKLIAPWVYT